MSASSWIRHNVLGLIAIFIALGGTAVAAGVAKNSVKSKQIADGQVKTADLGPSAVDGSKVKDGGLSGADLAANSITGAQINEGSLDSAVLQRRVSGSCPNDQAVGAISQSGTVTCESIGGSSPVGAAGGDLTGSYPDPSLAADSVTTPTLAAGAVTGAKLGSGAVASTNLAANAVGNAAIADNAIGGAETVDNSLGAADVDEANLDAAVLQRRVSGSCPDDQAVDSIAENGTVGCESIGGSSPVGSAGGDLSGTYPNPTLAPDSVTNAEILNGSIAGADLMPESIATVNLQGLSVTGAKLADGAVTGVKLADGAVTGAKLGSGAVGGSNIAQDAVGNAAIADNAVGGAQTIDNSLGGADINESNLDSSVLQSRVSNACLIGREINSISATGSVTCGSATASVSMRVPATGGLATVLSISGWGTLAVECLGSSNLARYYFLNNRSTTVNATGSMLSNTSGVGGGLSERYRMTGRTVEPGANNTLVVTDPSDDGWHSADVRIFPVQALNASSNAMLSLDLSGRLTTSGCDVGVFASYN